MLVHTLSHPCVSGAEVRGSACGFPATGDKVKGKAAELWVVAEGNGKNSPRGNGDTAALDICGQDTGNSGEVGGPMANFRRFCKRERL